MRSYIVQPDGQNRFVAELHETIHEHIGTVVAEATAEGWHRGEILAAIGQVLSERWVNAQLTEPLVQSATEENWVSDGNEG